MDVVSKNENQAFPLTCCLESRLRRLCFATQRASDPTNCRKLNAQFYNKTFLGLYTVNKSKINIIDFERERLK